MTSTIPSLQHDPRVAAMTTAPALPEQRIVTLELSEDELEFLLRAVDYRIGRLLDLRSTVPALPALEGIAERLEMLTAELAENAEAVG